MAVPTVMTDLSVTAASNSPAGTDAIDNSTGPDDYIRALAAIIRRGQAQGANVASAATVNIGAITDGNYIHITGTTTITAFDTVAAGISRILVFAGALTLTHNATSLILPGGANITTAAGDVFMFVSEGSGNWRCTEYLPAAGNVTASGTTTLTNKTINLTSNTLTGTVSQFNTACSDDNFSFLATNGTFSASQRGSYTTLTDGATISINLASNNFFKVLLGGNRTLDVPTNIVEGQSGQIDVYQDGTGSRSLAYAWPYQFASGTAPTLTIGKYTKDILAYTVDLYKQSTITVTIATPGVVTWTSHGLYGGQRVQITTTGALPTGLTASTSYYIIPVDANSFQLATSLANAQAGTAIATSGSQSGVHTMTACTITIASIGDVK